MQSQRAEETAGKPPQDPPSPKKPRCFQDILDIVFGLSDDEWRTLTKDVPNAGTKVQFAALCTKIIVSVCKSAVQSYLPTLLRVVGMEAVLMAEEKLRKKAESASISPSGSNTAGENSAKRSSVDPSDLICHIVEDFVSEVKTAMEESICKVTSCKESSWSKDWKTTCSRLAKEMLKTLEVKMKRSHLEDSTDLRAQDKPEVDTEALTGKIIVVVLDVLKGNSAERTDHETRDLLITTAERLKQIASTSDLEERVFVDYKREKVHLPPEELQSKATRAVSQVLLSSPGVWEMNSSSPEMPSSLASQTDLDSMLEAMAQSGFPTDLMRSHLDATSRDIVNTIHSNMDTFSSTSPSMNITEAHRALSSDPAKDSMIHLFQRINEKVKMFFNASKKFLKKRSTEVKQNTEPSSSAPQTSITDDLTNDVIGGIVRLYHSDVLSTDCRVSTGGKPSELSVESKLRIHGVMQELETIISPSRSSSTESLEWTDLEESKDISLPESVIANKEAASPGSPSLQHVESLFSDKFQEKATQAVSDVLLNLTSNASNGVALKEVDLPEGQSVTSFSSSCHVESAASDITKTFLKGLQRMSSHQVDHASVTEAASSPKNLRSAAQRLYRNVYHKIFGFLLRRQESQTGEESIVTSTESGTNIQTLKPADLESDDSKIPPEKNQHQRVCSTQDVPTSDLQLSTVHSVSILDDLTVTCTNNIISEIVQLYHSDASPECQTPTGDTDSVEISVIFQDLEELVRASRSSSKTSSSVRDVGQCKDRSFPELDSAFKDTAVDRSSSHRSVERLFSAQFQRKATQTVSEVLLKTVETLSTSGSAQSFESSSRPAAVQSSVAASSLSIQAQSTASDIMRSCLKHLLKCLPVQSDNTCSSTRPSSKQKKREPSAAPSIYRGVQKKVFGFLLGIQSHFQPFSERSEISTQDDPTKGVELESGSVSSIRTPPHLRPPGIQLNLDSCADEVIDKVVEFYKSELLLSSSSEESPHISTSLPEQSLFKLKKPKSFLTDAVKIVSDVLVRKPSLHISSIESSQLVLDSSRETSSSPILSTTSKDLQNAAVTIAETVVDALDRYVESKGSAMATVDSSCEMLSCLDALSRISVSSIPKEPDSSERTAHSNPFFIFRKVKDLLSDLFMGAVPERTTDPEHAVIVETSDSAAEAVAEPQSQSFQHRDAEMSQPQHLISDEAIRRHADRLTHFDVLRYIKGPSHVWRRSSDSVLDTSWVRNDLMRDPILVHSSLVYIFVDESIKTLIRHLLSLNSPSSHVKDPSASLAVFNGEVLDTSAGSEGQDRRSDRSAGSQCVFTDTGSQFTKALTDPQSKTEDLLLLVDSEQTTPERNRDVSPLEFTSPGASPTTSSRAGSARLKETDDHSISSQDYETCSSSSSTSNHNCSLDPVRVAVKKSSRGFRFIVGKKAPVISLGVKKSSKVCPAVMVSDNHQSTSSSGNVQESSQTESTVKLFRKTRKHLSRIFTAIRKALPNPFQCMTPPS